MKQYLNLLENIVNNGVEKESGRANMPNTIGLSRGTILMENVQKNFPLLTTKKMFLKGVIHELLFFLRGETNIKYLVDNNVNIWNDDAYRWYLKWWEESGQHLDGSRKIETIEEFIEQVKQDSNSEYEWKFEIKGLQMEDVNYKLGDLGKVYGHQWRDQNGIDQIKDIYNDLNNNPFGRYKILDGWNKKDFPEMALPPCHLLYQFIVRPLSFKERRDLAEKYAIENNKFPLLIDAHGFKGIPEYMEAIDNSGWNIPKFYLDVNMYQRSVDTFLGCPFNLASMSLFLMIMAKATNMIAGDAFWIGGDTHLYIKHLSAVEEQLSREPYALPKMNIKKELNSFEDIIKLSYDDFELVGYESHPRIKAELFTGLKK